MADTGALAAFDMSGRVAVVTGAASGIGRDTARVLAECGADVVLGDIDANGLAETAALVTQTGRRAHTLAGSVADRAIVEALGALALDAGGRLDAWVNAAGIIFSQPVVDTVEADLDRLLAVNLKGVLWGCATAGRIMSASGGGAIVNISSTGGERPVPGLSAYAMSKASVNMLTRTLATELGGSGVRVNAIAPGWVETPLAMHSFRDASGAIDPARREAGLAARREASPLGLTGVPRDIALAALYLASDAGRFVTGQILRPNGGASMP